MKDSPFILLLSSSVSPLPILPFKDHNMCLTCDIPTPDLLPLQTQSHKLTQVTGNKYKISTKECETFAQHSFSTIPPGKRATDFNCSSLFLVSWLLKRGKFITKQWQQQKYKELQGLGGSSTALEQGQQPTIVSGFVCWLLNIPATC